MNERILNSLLLRQGLQGNEQVLEDMITDCIEELKDMLNYSESDTIPASLDGTIKELVMLKFNQDGVQGILTESQSSGRSTTYLDGIPKRIQAIIHKYRKIKR